MPTRLLDRRIGRFRSGRVDGPGRSLAGQPAHQLLGLDRPLVGRCIPQLAGRCAGVSDQAGETLDPEARNLGTVAFGIELGRDDLACERGLRPG